MKVGAHSQLESIGSNGLCGMLWEEIRAPTPAMIEEFENMKRQQLDEMIAGGATLVREVHARRAAEIKSSTWSKEQQEALEAALGKFPR